MFIRGTDEYTPKETLKCAAVSRTYACSPAGQGVLPTRRAVKIIRLSSFPSYWSFKDNVRRECRVVDFLMTQSSHVCDCNLGSDSFVY